MNFKLANIILKPADHAAAFPEIFYRAASSVDLPVKGLPKRIFVRDPSAHAGHHVDFDYAVFDEQVNALKVVAPTDFMTFTNALSAGKWHKYAALDTVMLHLELSGRGRVLIRGIKEDKPRNEVKNDADYSIEAVSISTRSFDAEQGTALDLEIPLLNLDLAGFTIEPDTGSTVIVTKGYYYAEVEESAVNPVRLALCTTTFNNEQYILPNIELVKTGMAAEGDPVASNFHMFVSDNGRTLDVDALSDDIVTVMPNPNAGGSGGFARGMMAATENPGEFTHVLIMDDDVSILPESLIRTYNLLCLAQGKYKDAFINGAMLSLQQPNRQFEDVSEVAFALYRRLKYDLFVDELEDIVENERVSVEVPNAYGAWWYSVIPTSAIEKNGLPVPFFIRCDDVEFGIRNQPTYMTMNGICVWHSSFEGRLRANVDAYNYSRNFLAMIAMDECSSEVYFMTRFKRDLRIRLRDFDYIWAEQMLDGLEDYLKGPEYLENLNGSQSMKERGAKNEKLVPVEELDQDILKEAGVTQKVLDNVTLKFRQPVFLRYWRLLPYDRHYLPESWLSDKAHYIVKNNAVLIEGNAVRAKTVVFLDSTRKQGIIRTIDYDRFKAIRKRESELMARYRKEGKAVHQAWKDAKPYLTSREFWTKYLGEDGPYAEK